MKIKRMEVREQARRIAREYAVSELCAQVLACRCQNEDQIRQALSTDLTLEPCRSDALRQALQRLEQARDKGERILIAGDYDADGLCATAILKEALELAGMDCGYYIPHRLNEGYGLSAATVTLAAQKGYRLIITVDNGVAAHPALLRAKKLGIDVIVTDHHTIQQQPDCLVLLHPQTLGEPWQHCCGAAVALQLALALNGPRKRPIMLAALATIADMMPLWQQNRPLVRLGLKYLNQRQYAAVEALSDRRIEHWTEKEIAFQIVPKLNAIGRLADLCNANQIVRYLLLNDPVQIEAVSRQIRQINQKRRQMSERMTKTALEQIDPQDAFHFVADSSFHEGIVGLVAGRILNQTRHPTLVLAPSQHGWKGSARSLPGVDLQALFDGLQDCFLQFGGHAQAAGIEVRPDQLQPLRQALLQRIRQQPLPPQEAVLEVLPVEGSQITLEALHQLDQLAPFGQQFDPVLFEVRGLTVLDYTRMKETYPKWQTTNGTELIEAISFHRELDCPHPEAWIGSLTINRFRGQEKCSILVETVE